MISKDNTSGASMKVADMSGGGFNSMASGGYQEMTTTFTYLLIALALLIVVSTITSFKKLQNTTFFVNTITLLIVALIFVLAASFDSRYLIGPSQWMQAT